MDYFNKV